MATKTKRSTKALAPAKPLEALIHIVRGQKVMLDSDLAALYGVETKQMNRGEAQCQPVSGNLYVPAFQRRDFEVPMWHLKRRSRRSAIFAIRVYRAWCRNALKRSEQ
jgi:hypothetical protein